MLPRTIKVLHIEDDLIQRMSLAHHLAGLEEYHFAIRCVASEDAAVETFRREGADLILLDYQLSQGNGLNCLHQLRRQDATVPVIAISGVATPRLAAELLAAGADEYLNKHELDHELLARSVRHLLARTEGLRQGIHPGDESQSARIDALFRKVCDTFRCHVPAEFFQQLDELEVAARQSHLTAEQLQWLYESACGEAEPVADSDPMALQLRLRPVLLEILVRLFGSTPQQ